MGEASGGEKTTGSAPKIRQWSTAGPLSIGDECLEFARGSRDKSDVVPTDDFYMGVALQQAEKSLAEGGLPIGAVLVENDTIIAQGHNQRVQRGDPIAHGEMDCLRAAGRRPSYRHTTLYTTLSPCMMCAGTIVQFKIPRVVVGENRNFAGNIGFLRDHDVHVTLLDSAPCVALMEKFIRQHPTIWNEDIAE